MPAKPLSPSQKLDQYIVRFPEGMRDYVKSKAAENSRSINAEIIARLQDTMTMDQYYLTVKKVEADPAQLSRSAVQFINSDIKNIMRTLLHYKTQHMWRDEYVDSDRDREIMAALDAYLAKENADIQEFYSDKPEEIPEYTPRSHLIREILEKFLCERGFLKEAEVEEIPF